VVCCLLLSAPKPICELRIANMRLAPNGFSGSDG
jgi:hypothetical protein